MPDGRQVSSAYSQTGDSPFWKIDFYNNLEYIEAIIYNEQLREEVNRNLLTPNFWLNINVSPALSF